MDKYQLEVLPEQSGLRLDLFLMQALPSQERGFSRTFIQELISEGKVSLGGRQVQKANYKVKSGDKLEVEIEERPGAEAKAEDIPLIVVYEDKDLAVINKPAGLVVHPAPGNYEHTLVSALLYRFKKLSDINPGRPGIVHRLDKDTSGLLVVARNNSAHLNLAKQFAEHSIERKYVAIVKGKVEFDENVIEAPIVRHPLKRKNMSVGFSDSAKYAKTVYKTLKRTDFYSLLELRPFTGRTHQLRVHLAHIGHPILGDAKYGNQKDFPRLALHAQSIGFIHPGSKKFVEFYSDMPQEFTGFLKNKKS